MALQFIFGSSGSGKSDYIYTEILRQSGEDNERLFFVVVPEQFTMQTQQELVRRQKNHGIMNIDVVSFQRLAYRVFDELGMTHIRVLQETGKNFVLRKVAQEKQEELQILKGNMKKPGYINEMKSVISELVQYRIGPGQLKELSEDEKMPSFFRARMHDIMVMYQGFQDYLSGSYITAEELLEALVQAADRSKLLKGAVLVLDGFTGFTPIQYELLEELMRYVGDIYVTVTLDIREDPFVCTGMQELFYMSKKTVGNLSELAGKRHVPLQPPVLLSHSGKTRFGASKQLEWLEQNLFRTKPEQYRGEGGGIFLYSLPNPRKELMFVCSEIRRLVREEQYRYREIAIVCGDVAMYGNYVPEIFEMYEIPYFLDKKNNISFHAFTELIKAALRAVETDFSYEGVMDYLRCGLSGLSREEIDLLENYLLANRIRGYRRWQEKWVRLSGTCGMEELEQVNKAREQVVSEFEKSYEGFRKKEASVLERTVALYELIAGLGIQQKLECRRQLLEEQGRQALAKEYAQIYRIIMDLLEKLTQLLGEENMGLTEYRQLLEAGFEASVVGVTPPGYDQVLVGDIERSRLPDLKALFLVGVNDGLIPKAEKPGGLISQQERQQLGERGMELAPGAREKSFIQKFYLYLNLTKPSRRLYLTWFRTGGDGKEARKSYLAGMVGKLFPDLVPVKLEEPEPLRQLATEKSSSRVLVEGMKKAREGELSPIFLSLLSWYQGRADSSARARQLLEAAFYTYETRFMSREATRELYGSILENSVTRLERFAACAYAHFMAYGIGVKERQLGEFAPVDMGSLFHGALERYSLRMEELGYHWFDVPKELQEQLMEEAVRDTVEEAGYPVFQDARSAYSIKRLLRILKKTVEAITDQISRSSFTPEGYEISFSFVQDLEAVNFTLSEEERMRLRGRIDRMDTKKEGEQVYVKVVDYKSGNTQFSLVSLYHGLQLQLVVYLNAAVELLKRKYPASQVLPAGMFYYHIDDPVIEVNGPAAEEEIQEKVREQLKLNGAGILPDESVSRKSRQADMEEMKVLSDFVNAKIRSIGRAIFRGDTAVNPYRMKKESGCDYCPYHGICGFDLRIPGFGYRRLEEPKDKNEILEKMRQEIEGDGDGNDIHGGTKTGH